MSTRISKKRFVELLRTLIKKEIDEASPIFKSTESVGSISSRMRRSRTARKLAK